MVGWGMAAGAAAAWALVRGAVARRVEREVTRRQTLGADGILPGAASIALDAGPRAVLVLHGFGDTPQSVRPLADGLHARGWTVRAPLLPGHGRTLQALARTGRHEWMAEARASFEALRASHATVAVVGQSMGGALAVVLAAGRKDVAALALLAPYLAMRPRAARLARWYRVVGLFAAWLPTRSTASIRDPVARDQSLGAGYVTPRLLHELLVLAREATAVAGAATAPTLMLQSPLDNRIDPATAARIFERLGGVPKGLSWVPEAGHVLAVDVARERVTEQVALWLDAHGPGAAATGSQVSRSG
jgi:carboxylesterase